MDVNQIGTMVRAIRVVRGLNQAELAEKSEVDPAYISRLERNMIILPDKYLEMIEKALDVSFEVVRPSYDQFVAAILGNGSAVLADGSGGDGDE
jgi:transcriptional regulator with XRE-family HTH domain